MENYLYRIVQDKSKMNFLECDTALTYLFDGSSLVDEEEILNIIKGAKFKLKDGHEFSKILYLNDAVFVFSSKMMSSYFKGAFDYSGEILEIYVENAPYKYYIGNITHCMNIVDYEKSIFGEKDKNGHREILHLEIKENRLSTGRSLFKLVDNASLGMYCLSGFGLSDGMDFKKVCKKIKLDFVELKPILKLE